MNFKRTLTGLKNGAISSISSSLFLHPFQVLSTNMMINYKNNKPLSLLETVKTIFKTEGLRGFYRGTSIAVFKTTFGSAIYFGALENTKHILSDKYKSKLSPIAINFISAAISRTLQMISVAPLNVIKTRLEVNGFSSYDNIFDALKKIKRDEGYRGYFHGLESTLVKEVPYSAMFYTTYEFTKKKLKFIKKHSLISPLSGIITVAILTVLTNPFEVVRARIQYQFFSQNVNHKYKGVFSGVYQIAREEGVRGLTAGIAPVFIKKGFSTVLVWTIYDTLNKRKSK